MNLQIMLTELHKVMTDDKIARICNTTAPTICRVRNGRTKKASFDLGIKIYGVATIYGIVDKDVTQSGLLKP